MANEVLVKDGTPAVWADTTDYNPSAGVVFTRTAQLDLTDLADGAARQGTKADLGATRAARYGVFVGFEFAVAPAAGTVVNVWWSPSYSATAGLGNTGGASGADGAYQAASENEWEVQNLFVGSLICTNDATTVVQVMCINQAFCPPARYGMPIVVNEAGQAFEGDAVEMYVAVVPFVDEVQ